MLFQYINLLLESTFDNRRSNLTNATTSHPSRDIYSKRVSAITSIAAGVGNDKPPAITHANVNIGGGSIQSRYQSKILLQEDLDKKNSEKESERVAEKGQDVIKVSGLDTNNTQGTTENERRDGKSDLKLIEGDGKGKEGMWFFI